MTALKCFADRQASWTEKLVPARDHAVERSPDDTILHTLAGCYLRLTGLLQVRLHLYPADIADAPFRMDLLQAVVGILRLPQRRQSLL